ncbi:MAG: hypothetical protein HYR88_05100 [Verrucomicrobia bacterium]|nr:hypothetical protein [Verrucomicrobiota bacterium]
MAPYLHWIRFVREGVLLAALDRRDVEALAAVGGGVPTQAIVDRFKNQERLIAEAALPPNESEKPEAASRLRAEGDGGDAVLDPEAVRLFNEFAHRFETNLVELLEIQDEFRLMRNVDEIITRVSLRARSERLTRDLRIVEARRLLLINPALEWEHTTPGSVDPSSRRAAAQRIAAQYKASVEGERLFDALKAQGDSVEKYVSLLLKAWGVWTVEKEGFYWVRFSDAALGREHDAARDAVTKREKDAVKAYHDWTEKAWGGIYARPEPSRDPKTRPKALPKRS